jgi:trimethylamine--corrinoid protein Co-methyltransferase
LVSLTTKFFYSPEVKKVTQPINKGQVVSLSPSISVLTGSQKKMILDAVLEVLERTGVKIDNEEGRELLYCAGARVDEANIVRIPGYIIEDAVKKAPSQFSMYNRLGEPVMRLGGSNTYYSSQFDAKDIDDPFEGRRRRYTRADTRMGAVLSDALPNIAMASTSAMYSDVPGEICYLVGHRETAANTIKPIMHGTMDVRALEAMIEMDSVIMGSREKLREQPYYLHYAEPLSPLIHTQEGVSKLLCCAENGIPTIYAPACMGGGTAPVTGAGLMVAALAETLSGLAMAQLKHPGTPVIVGSVVSILDMASTIFSYGAPEMSLWSAGMAEMAEYLDLPLMSTAGCTDAVTFDEQAAAESAISCLMAALSGGNLVHDVGFAESANHASLELIAAGDELIGMIRHIMNGIEVSPEALAIDAIHQVGHGGTYLDKKHTFKYFKERWRPSLMARINHESWKNDGSRSMGTRCRERVCKIIKEHEPVPLTDDVISELDRQEKYWFDELVSS